VAYETKASRSTNTRVSEMANLRRISGQVRDPFAQPKGYQNYKFLWFNPDIYHCILPWLSNNYIWMCMLN